MIKGSPEEIMKKNIRWITKELPVTTDDFDNVHIWCGDNLSSKNLSMNQGMVPFLLPLGKPVEGGINGDLLLRLQYMHVNHNHLHIPTALEIANNLSGNPMKFQSGHENKMGGDMDMIFYQSNEV
jgi:hypothetical protein